LVAIALLSSRGFIMSSINADLDIVIVAGDFERHSAASPQTEYV
jgi:hypothetical protein